jgi:NFU1 iron-sulfur cluster scaffold homolog, mitochondrial
MFTINQTSNPSVLKFKTAHILTQNSFEFSKESNNGSSPLATQLLQLPFITGVFISANFIALQKAEFVEWDDVKEELKAVLEDYFEKGNALFINNDKIVVEVYAESTPNPEVMKFVTNQLIYKGDIEFKSALDAKDSPFIAAFFDFDYVKSVFVENDYISITKDSKTEWFGIINDIREYIKHNLKPINKTENRTEIEAEVSKDLDDTSKEIITILDEYIKPAVMADGGNIIFDSYDTSTKLVKVILKGACNGCPSSTVTLKNGIESTLKNLLPEKVNIVVAL